MSHYQIHPSEPHLCPCQTAVTSWKPGGWGCLAGFQLPGMSAGWVGTAVAQGDTHRHTGLAIWPRTQGWEPGRERDKACPGDRTSGVLFICISPCPLSPVPLPSLRPWKPSCVTHITLMHSRPTCLGRNVRWRKGSASRGIWELTELQQGTHMPELLLAHRCLGHKS